MSRPSPLPFPQVLPQILFAKRLLMLPDRPGAGMPVTATISCGMHHEDAQQNDGKDLSQSRVRDLIMEQIWDSVRQVRALRDK